MYDITYQEVINMFVEQFGHRCYKMMGSYELPPTQQSDMFIADERFAKWGPYDYVIWWSDPTKTQKMDHHRKYTIAELAAHHGYLRHVGQYWWHDPYYASKGNCVTVAMTYYWCVVGLSRENISEIGELPKYWCHEPDLQFVSADYFGPTVAMICAMKECFITYQY